MSFQLRAGTTVCTVLGFRHRCPTQLLRSFTRNIDNSGVPASIGQEITGHLDDEVYRQYNKKSESDLLDAAQKLEAFLDAQAV
jgi:hypothetical protein